MLSRSTVSARCKGWSPLITCSSAPGQLSDGLKIADIQIVHPGPPGGGVVADILLGQLALDFRAVGVTVFHAAGKVKYPGIHRRQFNQFIALFYKNSFAGRNG